MKYLFLAATMALLSSFALAQGESCNAKVKAIFTTSKTPSGTLVIEDLKKWNTTSDEEASQVTTLILEQLASSGFSQAKAYKASDLIDNSGNLQITYNPTFNVVHISGKKSGFRFYYTLYPEGKVSLHDTDGGPNLLAQMKQLAATQAVLSPEKVVEVFKPLFPSDISSEKISELEIEHNGDRLENALEFMIKNGDGTFSKVGFLNDGVIIAFGNYKADGNSVGNDGLALCLQ